MNRIFQEFVERLFESTDHAGFRDIMAKTAAALDLRFFAYLALPAGPDASPRLISTYPASWTTHYLQSGYERLDPVILWAAQSRMPFEWGLGAGPLPLSAAQRQLFDEAAQFEIRHGLTIPLRDAGGGIAAVTFAVDERYPIFDRHIRRQERLLQLMALYFHAHVRRKLARGAAGPALSPRELECLRWAAEGKSNWEIGRILGISRRTVAFHLDNAKAKLGVRTNLQAVAAFVKRRND